MLLFTLAMRLPLAVCVTLAASSSLLPGAGAEPVVRMLVPGFTVQELPVRLSNLNNLRFAPDGRLTALGYDGRVWLLRDTDGDGLEDLAEPFWDKPTLSVPVGMAWSTAGLFVSSHGKVSLLRDTDGDGKADLEEVVADGWPATDVGSGGVDATAVTLDPEGNVYFGLVVADYSNAYRLRKRKDLNPGERSWLEAQGRKVEGEPEEEVSLYDIHSRRGTIQKWSPKTKQLETLVTGIRVPVALAFNRAGDLFNTDQEGETWMPDGNPLDELNHIIAGRNYGFPPRHERWLPGLISESPVVAFGPQHESTCGLVFNEPHPAVNPASGIQYPASALPASPAQGLFGPTWWEGDAFVAGESRGKIWRVRLVKTPSGYVGREFLVARLSMLTTDLAISPRGDLYVSCHSGLPDWGTGPQGEGKIFKISYTDSRAPQPVFAWAAGPKEVRVTFDKPLDPGVTNSVARQKIEFGEFVRAADRYEVLKPPYVVVRNQEATPRRLLGIARARLENGDQTLVLESELQTREMSHAITIPGVKAPGENGGGEVVDLDYHLSARDVSMLRDWIVPHLPGPASNALKSFDFDLLKQPETNALAATTAQPRDVSGVGDYENGRDLFFGDQLKCSTCHRIRGEGATTGPDLSNLVSRDAASVLRDLKEPGASINPDYVAYNVILGDGRELSGFIREQDNASIKLLGADGKETHFRPTEVREMRVSAVSLMPTGLIDGLKEEQIGHLMTFLLNEPPKRGPADLRTVLATNDNHQSSITDHKLDLVLVASKQDHGPGQHDYPAWQKQWQSLLGQSSNVVVSTAWEWPAPEQFRSAKVMVFYYWNHDWNAGRLRQIDEFLARGGGIALFHSAVIGNDQAELLAERTGLASFASPRTKYRHMPLDLKLVAPENEPITGGLPRQVHFLDEPYWPLTGDAGKVKVLATTAVDGVDRPMIWTFQKGRGRVFGCVLGHYTWTFNDPIFRLLALRGVAWAADTDVRRFQPLATVSQ